MYNIQMASLHHPGKEGEAYQLLQQLIHELGLSFSPQLGIYSTQSMNAFATGPTPKRSLIALSSSLIHKLNRQELKSVIAHELGHILNGDMVTMSLLQGTIQSFVFFISRITASLLTRRLQRRSYLLYFMITFICEVILVFLGTMVISAFSRRREYKADRFSAETTSPDTMISALQCLDTFSEEDQRMSHLMISNKRRKFSLFSTHPSIQNRISALKKFSVGFSQESIYQR